MATFLSVTSSLLVGIILVVAPWTALWDANYLLQPHPNLRAVLLNPFLRGLVSGLGLLNMVLAVLEVHHGLSSGRERAGG